MNNVNLIGRLTKAPELRSTTSGKNVCTFTLAVNRKFKKDEADFLNIVAWDKTADLCSKYLNKGDQVGVTGNIQTRSYDDKDGKKVYITEIIAEDITFIGSGKKTAENGSEMAQGTFEPATDDEIPF